MALEFNHRTTYERIDASLVIAHAPTTQLSVYVGRYIFPMILVNHTDRYVIDLARMLTFERQVDFTQTLSDFLNERLTQFTLERYRTTVIPLPDIETRKYTRRIDVYDAEAAPDCRLAYTSAITPEIRNDVHLIESLPDIVISSDHRSFTHSLVAVNGVFHNVRHHQTELFVLDGNTNVRNCKRGQVVVVDTTGVGGHTTIQLSGNYYANTIDQDPRKGVYLNLPDGFDLTSGTPLVVIDGVMHPLDGTYEVVSKSRLKIHTNRIDLIHDFLHNPNTIYTHDKDGHDINPLIPEDPVILERPSIVDRITQFFTGKKLIPTGLQAIAEYRPRPLYKDAPDVSEKITYAFQNLSTFSRSQRGSALTSIVSMQYNETYTTAKTITATIPTVSLTSPQFVLDRMFAKHSFIVLLHTTNLYRNTVPLTKVTPIYGYEHRGFDCPRGIALYNRHLAIPYKTLVGVSGQYSVSTDTQLTSQNLYKTDPHSVSIPSPFYDQTEEWPTHPVEMVELFTA